MVHECKSKTFLTHNYIGSDNTILYTQEDDKFFRNYFLDSYKIMIHGLSKYSYFKDDRRKYTTSMGYDAFIILSDIRYKINDYERIHSNME